MFVCLFVSFFVCLFACLQVMLLIIWCFVCSVCLFIDGFVAIVCYRRCVVVVVVSLRFVFVRCLWTIFMHLFGRLQSPPKRTKQVITAVFCESAIESAQNDHAVAVQTVMAHKEVHLRKIRALFEKLGGSHCGLQSASTNAYRQSCLPKRRNVFGRN